MIPIFKLTGLYPLTGRRPAKISDEMNKKLYLTLAITLFLFSSCTAGSVKKSNDALPSPNVLSEKPPQIERTENLPLSSLTIENKNIPRTANLFIPLISAIFGGLITGFFSWKAVDRTYQNDLKKRKEEEENLVYCFLSSIQDEITTIWVRYISEIGKRVGKLEKKTPFLEVHPMTQNYFTIYENNSNVIGKIDDDKLRSLIVITYLNIKGLIDVYTHNNDMVRKYKDLLFVYEQNRNADLKIQVDKMERELIEDTYHIRRQHRFINNRVEELLAYLKKVIEQKAKNINWTPSGKDEINRKRIIFAIIYLIVGMLLLSGVNWLEISKRLFGNIKEFYWCGGWSFIGLAVGLFATWNSNGVRDRSTYHYIIYFPFVWFVAYLASKLVLYSDSDNFILSALIGISVSASGDKLIGSILKNPPINR